MKFWVLDDCYKVNPQNGNILELDKNNYHTRASHKFREKNPIWNGKNKEISLKTAKNETLGFQLMAEWGAKKTAKISVEISDFKDSKKRKFKPEITLYQE